MKKAELKINKYKNLKIKPKAEYIAKINIDPNGFCSLDSNTDIYGIELKFTGKARITPDLPKGWILQGNNNKIIIFTLQNNPMQKGSLFLYEGHIDINKIIVAGKNGILIDSRKEKVYGGYWDEDNGSMQTTTKWGDLKSKKLISKIKNTSYNLPDYNLPKVDKKQIKKEQKRTYNRTSTKTSSGLSGSGGY
tara:strand:- start:1213 stop:1788 length:576 start_codon:yes stop_codon:yes gene_type:complete